MAIVIGVIALVIGTSLMVVGYPEFKDELKLVRELPLLRRVIVYVVTFLGFLSLDSYLGWIMSLGLLFNFTGLAFIFLTIF